MIGPKQLPINSRAAYSPDQEHPITLCHSDDHYHAFVDSNHYFLFGALALMSLCRNIPLFFSLSPAGILNRHFPKAHSTVGNLTFVQQLSRAYSFERLINLILNHPSLTHQTNICLLLFSGSSLFTLTPEAFFRSVQ